MKYIILDQLGPIFDVPILFPVVQDHNTMAERFGGVKNVVSAGFVHLSDNGKPVVGGQATTIPHKPSRVEDADIIARALRE